MFHHIEGFLAVFRDKDPDSDMLQQLPGNLQIDFMIFHQVIRPLALRHDPQLLLVSAGFDAHWSDPLAMMALSLTGYAHLVANLVALADEQCDGRLVLTLEGGYDHTVLSNAVVNTCQALLGKDHISDPIGPSPYREIDVFPRIREVMQIHGLER